MRHLPRRHFAPQKFGHKNPNSTIESIGPCGRLRGNADQLAEKYTNLGRDFKLQRESVQAESCLQHAEHYKRLDLALKNNQMKRAEIKKQSEAEPTEDAHSTELNSEAPKAELPSLTPPHGIGGAETISADAEEEAPKPKPVKRRVTRTRKSPAKVAEPVEEGGE